MPISVVQEVTGTQMTASPGTLSITVTAGNLIHLWIAYDDIGSVWTISDSLNGSWGAPLITSSTGSAGLKYAGWRFNGTAGGTVVITAASSPATDNALWRAIEITGQVSGTAEDGTGSNYQTSTGAGTDAVTTGTIINANQPALLIALCGKGLAPAAAVGTGFSLGGTDTATSQSLTSENTRVTNTSGTAATFTTSDSPFDASTVAVFYDEIPGPTINTQPVQTTVYNGQTATFTVSATASSGSLSYQWTQNGSNVGTNSNSYTTPTNTNSNNFDVYQVAVTDSNGTVNSVTVYLIVIPTNNLAWLIA